MVKDDHNDLISFPLFIISPVGSCKTSAHLCRVKSHAKQAKNIQNNTEIKLI